jgi:chemotaxis protein methyltransferase CheR
MEAKIFEKILIKELGISLDEKRMEFVKNRLTNLGWRPPELTLSRFANIICNKKDPSYDLLVDLLTVHETYFFREYNQLEVFANTMLNPYAQKKMDKSIRILSAGCSTGEEAYTLAIILQECLDNFADYHVEIVGVDISPVVLKKAMKAYYSTRSVKFIPDVYREKYIQPDNGLYTVRKEILPRVVFSQANLTSLSDLRSCGIFDFIFCRNVLIYFNAEQRSQIIGNFHSILYPSGKLFLGHSESILKYNQYFEPTGRGEVPIYRRVA